MPHKMKQHRLNYVLPMFAYFCKDWSMRKIANAERRFTPPNILRMPGDGLRLLAIHRKGSQKGTHWQPTELANNCRMEKLSDLLALFKSFW